MTISCAAANTFPFVQMVPLICLVVMPARLCSNTGIRSTLLRLATPALLQLLMHADFLDVELGAAWPRSKLCL